jgi:hypothetical protein
MIAALVGAAAAVTPIPAAGGAAVVAKVTARKTKRKK